MRIKKYFHRSVLAGNISTLCLFIEMITLCVVIPVCAAAKLGALQSTVRVVFSTAALIGIPAAIVAATQARRDRLERP